MEPQPLSFRKPVPVETASLSSLTRAIIARAAAALDGGNRPLDYARATWPNDDTVALVLRAAVAPNSLANTTALVPVTQQFAAALSSLSAGGALMNAGIKLTAIGGNVSVPSFAPGQADFVAELAAIPVKQFVASGPILSPYKLASICVVSGEMIEHSDAEAMVRAALTESVAVGLDKVLFSNSAAVPGKQPAGILNGIAALTPSASTGGKTDTMHDDLVALTVALGPAAGAGVLFVAAPGQAAAMVFRTLQPLPNVFASSALPAGTVIAIAKQAFVGALEAPRIDASIEAIVHMDTAPAAIVNGGAMAAPVRSLFQTNCVGLRIITPTTWGLRAPNAVAWMQSVAW
jgi:Phage capsid family